MKVEVPFEFYKSIAFAMAEKITKHGGVDEIIAISRGGLVFASIIARRLKLDIGYFFPATDQLVLSNPESKRLVFIEDLIATGATLGKIKTVMEGHPLVDWYCVPFLIDAAFEEDKALVPFYGIKTSVWLVAPHETMDEISEGDRGYHRNRTDAYGGGQRHG